MVICIYPYLNYWCTKFADDNYTQPRSPSVSKVILWLFGCWRGIELQTWQQRTCKDICKEIIMMITNNWYDAVHDPGFRYDEFLRKVPGQKYPLREKRRTFLTHGYCKWQFLFVQGTNTDWILFTRSLDFIFLLGDCRDACTNNRQFGSELHDFILHELKVRDGFRYFDDKLIQCCRDVERVRTNDT